MYSGWYVLLLFSGGLFITISLVLVILEKEDKIEELKKENNRLKSLTYKIK